MKKIEENKKLCSEWFELLRNRICQEIQGLEEGKSKFIKKKSYIYS